MNARRRWWLPNIGWSLWLVFFLALSLSDWRLVLISADGDPALHRAIGNWMIDHHAVLRTEQFSHTRWHAPLISKEWLSEVIFAAAGRVGGWNGIVLLSAALIATTLWLLHRSLLAAGNELLLSTGLVLVAALASSTHWLARPHLVTHLLTVVFVWQLREFDLDRLPARRLWLVLPPLMALWTNLHGAFFTGFILIGLYFLGALWPLSRRKAVTLGGLLAVCLAVSLLNPNGWRLHAQVLEFLRTPALSGMTNEFRSPNFHAGGARGFVLLLLGLGVTLLYVRPKLRPTEILLTGVWGYFALHSVRNIPLFAIVVTPILASHWNGVLAGKALPAYRRISENITRLSQAADGRTLVLAVVAGLLLAVAVPHLTGRPSLLKTDLLGSRFPVSAVEFLRTHRTAVHGEMFNGYGYGGYLLWALPERKVFIDGRNDFYGKELVDDFNTVDDLKPGWEDVLAKSGVGWTLLPREHKLNTVLALDTGWKQVHTDSVATIYTRR